jgi:hypothetical protein
VDSSQTLTLDAIRKSLILQEDSIIFNLLLRAQYAYNANTYNDGALCIGSFHGSLVKFIVKETERLHAQVYYKRKYYNNHESSDFICLSFYTRRGGIEVQMSTRSSQKIYLTQCCFRRSIQRWEIFCCLNYLHWSLLWGCNLSYKTCPSGLTSELSIWGLVGASSVKNYLFLPK